MARFSNVIINGGTFNSAQGDFHINKDSEFGLRDLKLAVSLGAIHDSAERYPPPNCHPGTRKAVRQIILDWIHSENLESFFFWLYGPAGAGKSAICQAIAEFLCSPSGSGQNFGGSFFFSRGKKGRDQGHFLFSTIAYQLALKVRGLREHVNLIMELDPTLHTKSMDVQLQTLIVDAFRDLSPPPQRSYLVIIDGLDECHDKATQQLILRLLCKAVTVHKLPLRFLIGSRPESHLRASFDQESLYTITRRVVLDELFDPGRDIQVFLQNGFAKICAENSILSHVEHPWPSESIIDLLVQRSSGQFIYPATVLKFVGADFCSPTKQLALVLKPDPTAFSDLDLLYTQILSVYPSAVNIVQVLGIIIAFDEMNLPEVIEDIFGMEEGELKQVLRGLSSLMKDENGERLDKGVIPYVIPHFAHASFIDYLFDSRRSGPFHINRQEFENQITKRSFALIIQLIRSWRVLHTTTWDYFTSHLSGRFRRSPKVVKESIMTDVNNLVQEFWRTSSDGDAGASFFAMRRLLEILHRCFDNLEVLSNSDFRRHDVYSSSPVYAPLPDVDDRIRAEFDILFDRDDPRIRAKFEILFDAYRKMLDQSFSKSKDFGDILRFLPGVVVQKHLNMQGMADLYRIKPDLLGRLIKSTIEPFRSHASGHYILDDYLSKFLQDRDRSQLYYSDPALQHISICRHILSFVDGSNGFQSHHHDELSESNDFFFLRDDFTLYIDSHFYNHLCEAFLYAPNVSDDRPAIDILRDMETTAYCVEENLSGYILARRTSVVRAILRWADMMNGCLKGGAVSVSDVDLMDRVRHLTNKIYWEVLCTRSHNWKTYITMGGLIHVQVSASSCPSQYRIVLSWDLLACMSVEGRIFCSFTNFITTRELSGPLYISPDIYHTQITEFSLEKIYQPSKGYRYFLNPSCTFREHLSRALPTEMIFNLLRSIRSERLCSAEMMLDTLEVIINWLQGLGSERPDDLHVRFQDERLSRHMQPLKFH